LVKFILICNKTFMILHVSTRFYANSQVAKNGRSRSQLDHYHLCP